MSPKNRAAFHFPTGSRTLATSAAFITVLGSPAGRANEWKGDNTNWWDDLSWHGGRFENNVPDGDPIVINNPADAVRTNETNKYDLGGEGTAYLGVPILDGEIGFPNGITWKAGNIEKPLGYPGRESDPSDNYWMYAVGTMHLNNGGEVLYWTNYESSFVFCNGGFGHVGTPWFDVPETLPGALRSQDVSIGLYGQKGYAKTDEHWYIAGDLKVGDGGFGRLLHANGIMNVSERMTVGPASEYDQQRGDILVQKGITVYGRIEAHGYLTARSGGTLAAIWAFPGSELHLETAQAVFEGPVAIQGRLLSGETRLETDSQLGIGAIDSDTGEKTGAAHFNRSTVKGSEIYIAPWQLSAAGTKFETPGNLEFSPASIAEPGVIDCTFTSGSLSLAGNVPMTRGIIDTDDLTTGGTVVLTDTRLSAGSFATSGGTFEIGGTSTLSTGQLDVTGGAAWSLKGGVTGSAGFAHVQGNGAGQPSVLSLRDGGKLDVIFGTSAGAGGYLNIDGAGSRLAGRFASVTGSADSSGVIQISNSGMMQLTDPLTTGTSPSSKSTISLTGNGRLDCTRANFSASQSSETNILLNEGGYLGAPEGVFLNHGNFTQNTTKITMGGQHHLTNAYFEPGIIDSPFLEKDPSIGTATLEFRHDQEGMLFQPELRGVDIIEQTGPGETILRGRITGTDVIRADAGSLVIRHGAAPNTLVLGNLVRGGDMTIDASIVRVDPAGLSGTTVSNGSLSLVNGAILTSGFVISGTSGASPTALVNGSTFLVQKPFMQIGDTGSGRLTLRNAGLLLCDADQGTVARIGGSATGSGTVRLESQSEWRTNHVSVGYQGAGRLEITAGGKVLGHGGNPSPSVYVGDQTGSLGFVSIDGGSLDTTELRIGNFGTGTVEMLAGNARVRGATTVGVAGTGDLRVHGSAVFQADGGLVIGRGTGESNLLLGEGGTVRVGTDGRGILRLGDQGGAIGMLEISGSPATGVGHLIAAAVDGGTGSGEVLFSHSMPDHWPDVPLRNVSLQVAGDGRTSFDNELTLRGLDIYEGALGIYQPSINQQADTLIGSAYGTKAWLHLGNTFLSDGNVFIRGGTADCGVRIIGTSELHVGQGTGEVVMGRAASGSDPGATGGAIVFADTGGGKVIASAIRGVGPLDADWSKQSAVVFDHTAARHEFATTTAGTVALIQRGPGTTVIPGNLGHTGETRAMGGSIIIKGTANGTDAKAIGGGTLGGSGTIKSVTIEDGGILSPGDPTSGGSVIGDMRSTGPLSLRGGGTYRVDISDWNGATAGTHWDRIRVSALGIVATPEKPFVVKLAGNPLNFSETAKSIAIVQLTGTGTIPNPVNVVIDDSDLPGTGTWSLRRSSMILYADYTAGTETPFAEWARKGGLIAGNNSATDNPDLDGFNNLAEFSFDGNPRSASSDRKITGNSLMNGSTRTSVITLPVRRGANFTGSPALVSQAIDGVIYRIEASDNLTTWTTGVQEVTGNEALQLHSAMPALSNANWSYRSFRTTGAAAPRRFIRANVRQP